MAASLAEKSRSLVQVAENKASPISSIWVRRSPTAMTTYSWINPTSGIWGSAANWDVGIPNSATADAVIGASGTYTVSISAGQAFTVDSLLLDDAGASVAVGGTLAFGGSEAALDLLDGSLLLSGVIQGASVVSEGGNLVFGTGAILDGVTYQGDLDIGAGNTLSVRNGLTVLAPDGSQPGTVSITGPSGPTAGDEALTLLDSETLDNVILTMGYAYTAGGTLQAGSDSLNNTAGSGVASNTLTFGPGATLQQSIGNVLLNGNVSSTATNTANNSTLINQGSIDLSGGYLRSTNGIFENSGVMSLGGGETVDIDAELFSNTGSIGFSGAASLRMNPQARHDLGYNNLSQFANQGLISVGAGDSVLLTAATLNNNGVINIGSNGLLGLYNGSGEVIAHPASARGRVGRLAASTN
jgi:filamentous hemagglutinin